MPGLPSRSSITTSRKHRSIMTRTPRCWAASAKGFLQRLPRLSSRFFLARMLGSIAQTENRPSTAFKSVTSQGTGEPPSATVCYSLRSRSPRSGLAPIRVTPTNPLPGEAIWISGRAPGKRSRMVVLQRWTRGSWRTITHVRTGQSGAFRFNIRGRNKPLRFRLLARARGALTRWTSPVRTVRPTPESIQLRLTGNRLLANATVVTDNPRPGRLASLRSNQMVSGAPFPPQNP